MAKQPRTFTAPESGRYHFISGQEPHLARDCTDACKAPLDGRFVAKPGTYRTITLETVPAPETR